MTSNEAILQLTDVVENCVNRIGDHEIAIIVIGAWLAILTIYLFLDKLLWSMP